MRICEHTAYGDDDILANRLAVMIMLMLNVLQGTLGIYLQYLLERKGARMRDYCRAKWIITAERLITSVIILDMTEEAGQTAPR